MHIRDVPLSQTRPTQTSTIPTAPLSTAFRVIIEEWKRIASSLKESVVFYPEHIEPGDSSGDAPRWPAPMGSDVFMALEVQKANRLLESGPRTYSYVCQVADKLAFAIVARSYGIESTAKALQAGRGILERESAPKTGFPSVDVAAFATVTNTGPEGATA